MRRENSSTFSAQSRQRVQRGKGDRATRRPQQRSLGLLGKEGDGATVWNDEVEEKRRGRG